MKSFEMVRPRDIAQAAAALGAVRDQAKLLAGGTDLLGEMKDYLVTPRRLVNLKSVPNLGRIESDGKGGLVIGALVTLTQLEEDASVRKLFPALVQAIEVTAMPQIRNMATLAGNLCQRPRCWYYRDEHSPCLRKGGSVCFAASGENRFHAILGGGPCYIVHPSDPAPALIALGASVVISNGARTRTVPLEKFFVLPEQNARRENVLAQSDVLTHVRIPAPRPGSAGRYVKEREKDSYDWGLSAAAAVVTRSASGTVTSARIVLGAVAPAPWRATAAEKALVGKKLSAATIAAAAKLSVAGAQPLEHNAYKLPLTEAVVRRALTGLL